MQDEITSDSDPLERSKICFSARRRKLSTGLLHELWWVMGLARWSPAAPGKQQALRELLAEKRVVDIQNTQKLRPYLLVGQ